MRHATEAPRLLWSHRPPPFLRAKNADGVRTGTVPQMHDLLNDPVEIEGATGHGSTVAHVALGLSHGLLRDPK
jgi:hypothetical protein